MYEHTWLYWKRCLFLDKVFCTRYFIFMFDDKHVLFEIFVRRLGNLVWRKYQESTCRITSAGAIFERCKMGSSSSKRFSGHGRERLLVFYYNQVLGSKVGSYPRNRRLLTRRKVSRISTYFSMYMNCFVGSGNRVDCYFVMFIWHHKHLRFAKLNADSCHCFTSTFEMLSTAGFHVHLFARCRSYYENIHFENGLFKWQMHIV